VPSPEYYHRQADLCLRMALSAAQYEERVRLLDIANGYRASAVRVEACELSGPVSILSPTSANGTKRTCAITRCNVSYWPKADLEQPLA
jgi:hypothetical protein